MKRRIRDDRGMSVAVEAAILVPCLVLIIGAVIFGGRVEFSRQAVVRAAAEGARAASISRNAEDARTRAEAVVASSLATRNLKCASSEVVTDVSEFNRPSGVSAQASVTVTCVVSMSDIGIAGIPGTMTFTHTGTSPIDTYRER